MIMSYKEPSTAYTIETTSTGRKKRLYNYYEGDKGPYYVSNTSAGVVGIPASVEYVWPFLRNETSLGPSFPRDVTKPVSEEKFATEKHFLEKHKTELLKEYENKFIAIVNNEVVDSDEDFPALAKRVYKKFGYKDIFMPKLTKEREILHIPTPFLKKP